MKSSLKFPAILMVLVMIVTMFTGCNKANVDEPVTIENVNLSSVNVASSFIQSIFTQDREMFYKVYPENFYIYMEDDNFDPFEEYVSLIDPNFTYYGLAAAREEVLTEENGYDLMYLRTSISLAHTVQESAIQSLSLVKLRVYFTKDGDDDFATSDVYILTYKMDNTWYVFELANSDADFKA